MNTAKKFCKAAVFLCCILGLQNCGQNKLQKPEKNEALQDAISAPEVLGIKDSVEEKIPDPEPIVVPEQLALPAPQWPGGVGVGLIGHSYNNDSPGRDACPRTPGETKRNAAEITDQSRSPNYNGFLRAVWVDHGTSVNMITRGLRGFFTADSFFEPPLTVDMYLRLVGNYFHDNQDFVIMNCRPKHEQWTNVEPILATWPNTFAAIVEDLAGPNRDCSSPTLTLGEKQICDIAIQYQDSIQTVYDVGLADTLVLGEQMFGTTASKEALRKDYGIFPAYTGLGFTVKDSATSTGDTTAMTTEQILRNSVIPEYLLKNISLEAANCRCLQVPASASLHIQMIDPDDIWFRGQLINGACPMVNYLDLGL